MDSFYGGQSGKSFEIKKIFMNKKEMLADLNLRWQSPIGVSDYVIISYGLQGQENNAFELNHNIDLEEFGQSYNSTLWQKIYTENDRQEIDALTGIEVYYIAGNYGLGYKLITSMRGSTPKFEFNTVEEAPNAPPQMIIEDESTDDKTIITFHLPKSQVLGVKDPIKFHVDQDPAVEVDSSNIENPLLQFSLPRSQVISLVNEPPLDANQPPQAEWDITTNNTSDPSQPNGIDRPILKLALPRSQVIQLGESKPLHADQQPEVGWDDETDINNPVVHFELPRSQVISLVNESPLDAGTPPRAEWDTTTNNNSDPSQPSGVDRPILKLALPRSQVIQLGETKLLHADQQPKVGWDDETDINNPVVHFELPRSQVISLVNEPPLDANQPPQAEWDITTNNTSDPSQPNGIDRPILKLALPRSQVMDDRPELIPVAPLSDPKVTLGGTINNPKLLFELPRGIRFYYGSLLGKQSEINYKLSNVDEELSDTEAQTYQPGDYYINMTTGFIYLITEKKETTEKTTITFSYVGCLQAPLPKININPIDPYTSDGSNKIDPSVTSTFDNETEKTGWKLDFNLPTLPNFSVSSPDFIGSMEAGSVTLTPDSSNNVNFDIKLPRGSKIIAGQLVKGEEQSDVADVSIEDTLPGDLYLNTKSGAVYQLDKSGIWKFQNDGLKGPVGDSVNIARSYRIDLSEETSLSDSLEDGVTYIIKNYIDEKGNPLPYQYDEIFAVTWIDTAGEETAYWYFYTEENKWSRVRLGGSGIAIKNSYTESTDANPIIDNAYSIDYINKLIGGEKTKNPKTTTFSKDQIYALSSWGTFEEAKNNNWWPGPGSIS